MAKTSIIQFWKREDGIQTLGGGKLVDADKSIEQWWHPINNLRFNKIFCQHNSALSKDFPNVVIQWS